MVDANHLSDDENEVHQRLLRVSELDIAAARRLLAVIAAADQGSLASAESHESADRRRLVKAAQAAFQLRNRRFQIFGRSMFGEPPFDMMLALYVTEEKEPRLSTVRLAELASIPHSTAVRWLDYLAGNGFVAREPGQDKRRSEIRLLPKGRAALDELFGSAATEIGPTAIV